MSNTLYDFGRESFANGDIDLLADTIKVVGIDHGVDTPNAATDQYLSDLSAGSRIFTSAGLSTKTTTAGVLDADDVTMSGVTGSSFESLTLYKDTGVAGTSILILLLDTVGGLPFTPAGGGSDFLIVWDSGSNKIFKL